MKKEEIAGYLNRAVVWENHKYKLLYYLAWRDERTDELKHSLVLLDKNANSTVRVPAEQVEICGREGQGWTTGKD